MSKSTTTSATGLGKAASRAFDNLLLTTAGIGIGLILVLSLFVFGLTVSRYAFRVNIPGLFDIPIYALIVFPFLTAAYTLREGRQISVDFLTALLAERTRAILNIAVYLVSLVFVIVLLWQSWLWGVFSFSRGGMTTAVFAIPEAIIIGIMLFGCFLLILQIVRQLVDAAYTLPRLSASPRLRDNPWLCVSLFAIGIVASIVLLVQGNGAIGIILLALVTLFSGMPVFLALGVIGTLGIYFLLGPTSLLQMPIKAYASMNSFPLTCLPLFLFGGVIMEQSGIAEDMFRFFELWIGRWVASPLIVTIALGMVFCAISGSSVATTAVVAGVALPILMRRGFSKSLSSGVIGGSTAGTLIPPSIGYVVYAVVTDESVSALFMATMLPAMVLFAFYFLYVTLLGIFSKRSLFENGQVPSQVSRHRVTWRDRLSSLKTAIWGLLTPVIIIGGIYVGIYTPTEAAAVLVVYAFIVSVFIKKVNWRVIVKGALSSVLTSAMILCIIFSAYIFAIIISQLRVAASVVAWAEAVGLTSLGVIGIVFIILIIMGLFLDAASMKLITLPIFWPLAMSVGINNLWLGVFYQFLCEIGLLTPPVGLNLFVIQGVTGLPLNTVAKGNAPFILMMVLTLVIMYFFPQLVTWLPSTMK